MAAKTAPEFSCLIVEDAAAFATLAGQVVREENGAPTVCHTLAAAREAVLAKSFDRVLRDNPLPAGKGYAFFDQLVRRNPDAPIVMITGLPDLGEAVALTRNGLFDYLTKPISVDALAACLQRAGLRLAAREPTDSAAAFCCESPAMREVQRQLRQAAKHPASTVLFTGETGAGKDLAARVLHQLTYADAKSPFIAVNCAALPGEGFESELFGAERGAYTGAERKRGGLVAAAAGGTLFLDEIAEVPLGLQAKLLRLLDAREFRSLGSTKNQNFTGRFVTATNKHLPAEVKAGRFREDLLYRLDVFAIELPPLRERRVDIPSLAESLLMQLAKKYGCAKPMLNAADLDALSVHDFPGNVRELCNVLERSLLRSEPGCRWLVLDLNWLHRAPATAAAPAATPGASAPLPAERQVGPIEAEKYRLIRDTLRETNGGIRRAAAKLGQSPQALLRRGEKWPERRGS